MTHNDEAIVKEFSIEWHRLGIPNGALPNMQYWLRQAIAQARADQDKISRVEEIKSITHTDEEIVRDILNFIKCDCKCHSEPRFWHSKKMCCEKANIKNI